jgi:hypothetical protein
MTKHNVQLHEIQVISRGEVVEHHHTGYLIRIQMFIRKYNIIGFINIVK